MAGSTSDTTERKRVEEELAHGAFHDALTGLANRALFIDRLTQAINRSRRQPDYLFGVLFMDLDRFKIVNDSLGHSVGDKLLIAVAERVNSRLRSIDTLARLGGDEFAVLLDGISDQDDAGYVASRILSDLELSYILDGREVSTSASIGVVIGLGGRGYSADVLLRDADIAMYQAKRQGGNRYVMFDSNMRAHALERLEIESDLHHALAREELEAYYQPIVDIVSGRLVGFEALLRWHHPTRGVIEPDDFLSICEENGLILPIGEKVLREACRRAREWQKIYPRDPPLTVSVNLSPRQFTECDLVELVGATLADADLEPRCLKLEITEGVVMVDAKTAYDIISGLQALGVEIQLGDFGTGYSSLNYLSEFKLNTIKIDRSFVGRLCDSDRTAEVIRLLLGLAQGLGMTVIAEGIETEEQLARLQELECKYAQGFLFAKPAKPDAIERFLKERWQSEPPTRPE